MSRLERQQAGLLDFNSRLGNASANRALFSQRLAECHARRDPPAHRFERPFGHSDQPHAVVHPAWAEPALGDLEAASFAEQNAGRWYADVFKHNFRVTMRSMIVAKDGQHSLDLDARRIHRYEDHRLLLVAGRRG